ncbi:MAG: hypothetical protein ACOZF0_05835 [Thermodesulfobacteriota bacterium]
MKNKKQAAAITAVMAFLGTEVPAVEAPPAADAKAPKEAVSVTAMNLWGISGRQAQMQMRALMQTRALHGARLR